MNVLAVLNKPWVVPVAVGVAAGASGFIAGYKLGQRNMDIAWEERVNAEFDSDDGYDLIIDEVDVTQLSSDLVEKIRPEVVNRRIENAKIHSVSLVSDEPSEDNGVGKIISVTTIDEEPEEEFTRVNVFTEHESDWDEEAEVASRIDGEPYVIHETEYMENRGDWTQETVTYYAGDDMVADQADTPMYGHAKILGELKFGHGATDPKTVYIRNPQIHKEFEVLHHSGYFAVEVLGNTIEQEYAESDLKHSNDRKFRSD